MTWSFKIAHVAGIPIRVHLTFFLILALGAFQWAGRSGNALGGALFGMTLMILLFLCVTLHELGHSLTARAFGIQTREILLMPLGGVAQINRMPDRPLQEFLIAIAGPAVNVVIAAILVLVVLLVPGLGVAGIFAEGQGILPQMGTDISPTNLLYWVLSANISLVLFNLIPAFPLDGGRVLRSILSARLGAQRGTRIAAGIGQSIAIALGILGLISGNILLVLIAVFIFAGAGQENAASESKRVLVTRRLADAYNKHAITLQNGDRLSRVVDYLLTSYQPDFAVTFGNNLLGVVTREDVMRGLATQASDVYVSEIMNRDVFRLDAALDLDAARERMAEAEARVAAVYDGTTFLGLISLEDIQEAFAVLTFVQRHVLLKPDRR